MFPFDVLFPLSLHSNYHNNFSWIQKFLKYKFSFFCVLTQDKLKIASQWMSSLLASLDLFLAESSFKYRITGLLIRYFMNRSSFIYCYKQHNDRLDCSPKWKLTLAYRKCIHYTLLACVTDSFFDSILK